MVDNQDASDEVSGAAGDDGSSTPDAGAAALGRRSVLKLAGAAAAGVALPALADGTGAVPGSHGTRVNVVDAGADPTGGERIDSVIEANADDDTLLVFPDGTYRVGKVTLSGLTNFGMAAAEGANPTIVPAEPRSSQGEVFLLYSGGADWLLEGIDFDFTREGYGGRIQIVPSGDFVVRDVECRGTYPDGTMASRFDVRDSGGVGLVENFVARGGTRNNDDSTGIFVGKGHAGELTVRNCEMWGFSNNGLYASAPGLPDGGNGPVKVEGGLYKNNNIAGVRIGSEGSRVEGVTVVVDERPPEIHGALNSRGIRLRDRADQVIEDCDVVMKAGSSSGAIVFHPAAGRAYVRNTRVRIETDGYDGVMAKSPDTGGPTGPVFENVSITGTADAGNAARIDGRDGTEFRNCCISFSGGGQDGVVFSDSQDCVVADSTVDVPGQAVVLSDSTADTSNVTAEGSCPLPSTEPGDAPESGGGSDDGDSGDDQDGQDGQDDQDEGDASDDNDPHHPLRPNLDLPKVLVVDGRQTLGTISYQFSVTGELAPAPNLGPLEADDAIDGGEASGEIAGGRDAYRYSGEVESCSVDGTGAVLLHKGGGCP